MDTKMHTIFLCTLRHTQAYAFTWSLSHTHSHVQTRTRVAAHCPTPVSAGTGRQVPARGRPGHCSDFPLRHPLQVLRQKVGQGGGRHTVPSTLTTLRLVRLALPYPPSPLRTKLFPPSPPPAPPPSTDLGWNPELFQH